MSEPIILNGKALAKERQESNRARVAAIVEQSGRVPILATILVGDDPASATYVKMKGNACRRVGMESRRIELGASTSTQQLLDVIDELNADRDVHGILLQHPVPSQIDERAGFDRIQLEKDVDGVTTHGFGLMAMGEKVHGSATPAGIMSLLRHYEIPMEGKHAVVIGRSPILGKPMSLMLLNANATVTICHSRTRELPDIVRTADIVVGAVGRPRFVKADWVKPGAVLVDAGYNPGPVGDIDLENAAALSSAYTPVPGGVGPMTISTLITQTVDTAEAALKAGQA